MNIIQVGMHMEIKYNRSMYLTNSENFLMSLNRKNSL